MLSLSRILGSLSLSRSLSLFRSFARSLFISCLFHSPLSLSPPPPLCFSLSCVCIPHAAALFLPVCLACFCFRCLSPKSMTFPSLGSRAIIERVRSHSRLSRGWRQREAAAKCKSCMTNDNDQDEAMDARSLSLYLYVYLSLSHSLSFSLSLARSLPSLITSLSLSLSPDLSLDLFLDLSLDNLSLSLSLSLSLYFSLSLLSKNIQSLQSFRRFPAALLPP